MSGLFRLTLLPYLQAWDPGSATVRLNVIAYPTGDPRVSLTDGLGVAGPAVADASIVLRANLSADAGQLPLLTSVDATHDIALPMPADRHAVFDALAAVFGPTQLELPPANLAAKTVSKYLANSYRNAFAYVQPRTPLAVVDDSYRCMLSCPPDGPVGVPPQRDPTWADVFANALRVPQIMRAAGLLHTVEVVLPDPDLFHDGGWLSFTLAPTSDWADAVGLAGFVRSYATRVPPLSAALSRPVFTPVLFPLFADATAAAAAGSYDAVFPEALTFDDGFAKIVHATQPQGMEHLDEDGSGAPPVTDQGVFLGWDDEDVLIGQNRQLGLEPDGSTPVDAPRGIGGYRVDVRHHGDAAWSSLSAAHRDHVLLDTYDAGGFDGELRTEVHPRTIFGAMWLPAWFTGWTGGSLVIDTLEDKTLRSLPSPTPPLYEPVGAEAVPLRYGQTYDFRVRMADATGGGPALTEAAFRDGDAPVAVQPFLRYLPPRMPRLIDQEDTAGGLSLTVTRSPIDYPAAVFVGIPNAADALMAIHEANVAAYALDPTAVPQDVALPDQDCAFLEVRVMVRPPAFDRQDVESGWRQVYLTQRAFPDDPSSPLTVAVEYVDVAHLSDLDLTGQSGATPAGPVVVPSARDVRLELRALTRDDPTYFGNERARRSRPVIVDLHRAASAEPGLFGQLDGPQSITSVFLRNDPRTTAPVSSGLQNQNDATSVLVARLASAAGLVVTDGQTLSGPQGERVLFGCNGLSHRLSPEAGSLTLTHVSELAGLWVNVFRTEIDRDWTWKGAASPAVTLQRTIALQPGGADQTTALATVELPHSVSAVATAGEVDRQKTLLIYLDAFPAPTNGGLPYEIGVSYQATAHLENAAAVTTSVETLLPVTTPPTQVPVLAAAGHALSDYVADAGYAATARRSRMLWLEVAEPLVDPRDAYFVRVLAHSPDPLLLARSEPTADPVAELASPLDPELVRIVVPEQSDDFAGLDTMQKMLPAAGSDRHFLVPLPPGTTATSPELFGFYSYEIRVGHDAGTVESPFWSTAQGRFGPSLVVEGVQHPAPSLSCDTTRLADEVLVTAAFAQPFYRGTNVLPSPPNTEIWIALYVQVHQADRASMRNILLDVRQGQEPQKEAHLRTRPQQRLAEARWDEASLEALVATLGLDQHAPLSVLAIEVLPEPNGGFSAPLRGDLGDVRVLRTSPLMPLVPVCC